ncbi:NTP pyrophosphatase (non-canonical NTP hydrolase) [Alicyclobacillus cycloheptanicus]|uniref:NTP pyrophosphatase (Non-canonical NTP hydrolase) n=2 Tax=Alicyclobacillus cycloheptanicus TaxID=1457 RepID=A0ABT9XE40_9BACL|nr:NTP pyrophosphatase (non-canonical NTP hydrolase) [Alicyclobacillus cycloheptanicus]
MPMTLAEVQARVDAYIGQFQEGYFTPMTLVVRLAEELGELAREVNHHYGEKPKKPTEAQGSIALELGDLLFVITCLANRLHIDLEQSFVDVMNKFETRDRDRWTRLVQPPPDAGDKRLE